MSGMKMVKKILAGFVIIMGFSTILGWNILGFLGSAIIGVALLIAGYFLWVANK